MLLLLEGHINVRIEREKSPAPGRIRTHDLVVFRPIGRYSNCFATTSAMENSVLAYDQGSGMPFSGQGKN